MTHATFRISTLIVAVLLIGTPRASAQDPPAGLRAGGIAPGPLTHMAQTSALRWPGRPQGRSVAIQRSTLSSFGRIHHSYVGRRAVSRVPDASWALSALQQDRIAGDRSDPWLRRLAVIQGSYYLTTGLWPILSMRTFEKVTGPKTDDWLVKTVGALIAVAGGTLLVSGLGDGPSEDLQLMAAGSAGALAVVDITYVAHGRISRIYLLDAVAELALLAGWILL